jgi:hypothetical protein
VRHGGLRGNWKSIDGVVLPVIVELGYQFKPEGKLQSDFLALSYQFKQEGKPQSGCQVGPTDHAYPIFSLFHLLVKRKNPELGFCSSKNLK